MRGQLEIFIVRLCFLKTAHLFRRAVFAFKETDAGRHGGKQTGRPKNSARRDCALTNFRSIVDYNTCQWEVSLLQTVYVDVLLAVNLFIDYFLLLLTAKFLHISVRRYRLLLGALIGSGGSLMILLPPLAPAEELLLRLGLSLPITLAAFGFGGFAAFFRRVLTFFLFSFALAGILLAVWYFVAPGGLFVKNSVIYFYVPPLLLIVLTLISYFILRLVQRAAGRGPLRHTVCQVHAKLGGREVSFSARIDTGSALTEPFSGLPVIVAEEQVLLPLPDDPPRAVPYTSVGGEGLLRAWRAEDCTLVFPEGGFCRAECYIACTKGKLAGGEYQALVPPSLLQDVETDSRNTRIQRKETGYAGKTEAMASASLRRARPLHKRTGNTAAAAHQRGRS
ncbi:hypothetical protein B6259_02995 [Ruminococcaceae bacterium CPB6]|jgi:stage II sporulation protein GA (sporulation sigma-E factor processing peptidase)|uniref:Sigma-E processing peptidase SpoIIGA n=1 Tax=Caproicibacterium lactatifermentans TaxID=2666138 RepID=A0A859DR13_9FIRM|nr:hypothetical protein B6259_02995 [Ruminococcaceae bacterium CPB6]QKN24338.1 hypothetical protein GJQ69_07475 [Caproicibacterium lactatifermentans]